MDEIKAVWTTKLYDFQTVTFKGTDGNEVTGYTIAYGKYKDGQLYKVGKAFVSSYRANLAGLAEATAGQNIDLMEKDGKVKYFNCKAE